MTIAKKSVVWGLFAAGGTVSAFIFPDLIAQFLMVALGMVPAQQEAVVLREVIERAAAGIATEAGARQIHLKLDVAQQHCVVADPHRLQAALAELLRNACEDSAPKTTVEVTGATIDVRIAIIVTTTISSIKVKPAGERCFEERWSLLRIREMGGVGIFVFMGVFGFTPTLPY